MQKEARQVVSIELGCACSGKDEIEIVFVGRRHLNAEREQCDVGDFEIGSDGVKDARGARDGGTLIETSPRDGIGNADERVPGGALR